MSGRFVLDRVTYYTIRNEARLRLEGRLATLALCSLIALLPVFFFWQLTFGGEVLYWGTPLLQFYPWRHLAVETYLNGQVPLWNQYLGTGAPLAANLQSAVFYPFNAIFLLVPVERAMGYSLVAHVSLAGLFGYYLGRTLGFSRLGSTVTALSFMFSGFVISRAHFLSMTSVAAWFPLLLAAVERIIRSTEDGAPFFGKTSYLNLALSAIAAGMMLLAGHAQLAYYSFWFVSLYALYRGTLGSRVPGRMLEKTRAIAALRTWLRLVLGLGLGILLAAIQLLPTAELAMNSMRSNGAALDFAMAFSLYPWQLVGLIAPDFFGNPVYGDYWGPGNFWETDGYIGIMPLLFALLAIFSFKAAGKEGFAVFPVSLDRLGYDRRDVLTLRLTPFLIFIAVVSLLFALGGYLPIFPFVFKNVPGFGLFQAPSRFLYLYTFAMAILAGAGISLFQTHEHSRLQQRAGILVALGLGIFAGMRALGFFLVQSTGLKMTFTAGLADFGLLLTLTGVVLVARKKFEPAVWSVIVILFIIFDLLLANVGLNPSTDAQLYAQAPAAAAVLAEAKVDYRVLTPEKASVDRFFETHSFKTFGDSSAGTTNAIRENFLLNTGVTYGILEAGNYDPLQLENGADLRQEIDRMGPTPRLLNLFSARYVISDTAPGGYGLLPFYDQGVKIWENPAAPPRAYVVHQGKYVANHQRALAAVTDESFDSRSVVVIEGKEKGTGGESIIGGQQGEEKTRIVSSENDRVVIESNLVDPGYLVLTDSYYPGWRVLVDGQERPILPANYAFRAVELGAGSHVVEYKYEPQSFEIGAALSAVALVLVIGIGGVGALLWRREPSP